MELRDAVRGRRSIRRFLEDPVSEDIVNEIIAEALWAPSWGNTQPWEIKVVSGNLLKRFKNKSTEAFLSGKNPSPDIPMPIPEKWPDLLKDRYNEVGRCVLESLSISRTDHGSRIAYYAQMYSLFNAPVLILITVVRNLPQSYCLLDVGIFLQSFCLLAHDRGLGTCIMGASVYYSDLARSLFSIPETRTIVIGAALGWPDSEASVNRFERKRGNLEEFVQWLR